MKLTENEIRDITQYLEAGKDLPEKYRFLLFEDKKEVELLWNGKSGVETNVVLPFQVIEQVDEPRSEEKREMQASLFDSETGRQVKGWNNKLIWGDNKLILSSLKNGPLRKEIEEQGGIKLIYIDPPFDVGADFEIFGKGHALATDFGDLRGQEPDGNNDVENFPVTQDDVDKISGTWYITAPGGVETINFSGLGYVGFYVSSHAYEILDRTNPNEWKLKNYYAHEGNAWFWTITNKE